MVTHLALNNQQINKTQRAAMHPNTGKNAQHSGYKQSTSISKKTKLKNSVVDFTRNPSSSGVVNHTQASRTNNLNNRAQLYNTSSSIDRALQHKDHLDDQLKLASTVNQAGRRNDGLSQQMAHLTQGAPPPPNHSGLHPQQNVKISRKHIRANTSINNYQSNLNPLSSLNQQHMLTSSYNSQQKNPIITSAVGAVGAVKPIRDSMQSQNVDIQNMNEQLMKDQLNITNSLIISNSQILFQDIGNGKIIPIPFGQAMGTIQPAA